MDNTEFNSIKPSWNCKPLIRTPYKLLIFSLFASIFDTSNLSKSTKNHANFCEKDTDFYNFSQEDIRKFTNDKH